MGNAPEPNPKPFVQLKTGNKIEATNVKEGNSAVTADGKNYANKTVAFYSDGKKTFANTPKNIFTTLTYTGDINVYRFRTMYTTFSNGGGGFGPSQHTHTFSVDYLQKNGSNNVDIISYRNIKKYIPRVEPAYSYVKLYKKNRIIGHVMFFGGIATLCAGVAVLASNFSTGTTTSAQASGQRTGGIIMAIGMGSFLTSGVIKGHNKHNLQKARWQT